MGKILSLVLGLSVLGYIGYRTMYGRSGPGTEETPKKRLENVQGAANRIENQDDARLDALDKNTQGD